MSCKIELDMKTEWLPYFNEWIHCEQCPLLKATPVIYPRGKIPCDILFIGMNPGITENSLGFPMTGPTREEIDNWITMGIPSSARWAIQNVVACVTRETMIRTRDPTVVEVSNCRQRLIQFVRLADPGKIVILGEFAWKHFPKDAFPGLDYLKLPHPIALAHLELQEARTKRAKVIISLRKFTGRMM